MAKNSKCIVVGDYQARLAALNLAVATVATYQGNADDVVDAAEQYYDFLDMGLQ